MTLSNKPMSDPVPDIRDSRQALLEVQPEKRQGPAMFRWITVGMEYLIAVTLIGLILSVSANVVGRSVFNQSLPWADEVARMLFIWMVFIGAAAAFARYEHIAVDFLVRRMTPQAAYSLYLLQNLLIAGLSVVLIWGGFLVVSQSTGRTAILGVPWNLINASLIIFAVFVFAVALWRVGLCVGLIYKKAATYGPASGD